MDTIEDCWIGRAHDAKPLTNPLSGETLTWTGETLFGRVLPKAPKGKAWCNGELVRVRRGTQRAPDIHPLHWWLMSTSARVNSAAEWKIKHREILQAQNRRSIPRRELEKMPASDTARDYEPAAACFLRSDDASKLESRRPAKLERANDRCPSVQHTTTTTSPRTSTSQAASSKPVNVWELSDEVWQDPATVSVCNVSKPITAVEEEDGPPALVDESSDEEWGYQNGESCETESNCSSADWNHMDEFMMAHGKADDNLNVSSDGESVEGKTTTTTTADSIP